MDLYKMSLWQLFLAGGPVMWPILLCSIFALAIIIEKFWHLHRIKIDTQAFLNNILDKMKHNQIKEALESGEVDKFGKLFIEGFHSSMGI